MQRNRTNQLQLFVSATKALILTVIFLLLFFKLFFKDQIRNQRLRKLLGANVLPDPWGLNARPPYWILHFAHLTTDSKSATLKSSRCHLLTRSMSTSTKALGYKLWPDSEFYSDILIPPFWLLPIRFVIRDPKYICI